MIRSFDLAALDSRQWIIVNPELDTCQLNIVVS